LASIEPENIDKVFKALGHVTRRRILRLLALHPRYPYELSKMLDLNRRVVLKHLDALQEAGLVEKEPGESNLGPDRTYYKLNVRIGLSTTILPDTFAVRMTRIGGSHILAIPRGFIIPKATPDVEAVRALLNELNKVNVRLKSIDEERAKFAALRGKIIHRIEEIMVDCEWDNESCQRVRALLDPVYAQQPEESSTEEDEWVDSLEEAMLLLERLLKSD
jgi:predicted transcriptional regulator